MTACPHDFSYGETFYKHPGKYYITKIIPKQNYWLNRHITAEFTLLLTTHKQA
jgi:hypothetical protein